MKGFITVAAALVIAVPIAGCGSAGESTSTTVVPQSSPPTQSTPKASAPVAVQRYSGNGAENLGAITTSQGATLEWTNDGGIFQIFAYHGAMPELPVNSQSSSGSSVLEGGHYTKFQVNAVGNWTITIK